MTFLLEDFYPDTAAFLEVVSLYQVVWGGNSQPMNSSIQFFSRQAAYPEWRGVLARDTSGTILGFALGSRAEAGQWWFEHLRGRVDLAQTWCLVELAVLESARRKGVAQALHDALLKTVRQPKVADRKSVV